MDIERGARQRQVGCVKIELAANGCDLAKATRDGHGAGNCSGHPDGEEDRAYAAFPQARDVHAASGGARAEIEAVKEEALSGIDVGIHYQGAKVKIARGWGDNLGYGTEITCHVKKMS